MYYRPRKNIHKRLHKQKIIVANHLAIFFKGFAYLSNRKKPSISAFILLLCFAQVTLGSDKTQTKNQQAGDLPSISYLKGFDDTHSYISRQIQDFADALDTFFSNDRAFEELQGSRININLLQSNIDHKKPGYRAELRAKLVFPKTQKKLKLLIETQDEDEETQQTNLPGTLQTQEQTIGLRFIEKETNKWRVHTDTGLRFKSGIDAFARLRLRRLIPKDAWVYRIAQNFYWYRIDGAGEDTRLDIDHPVTEHLLFRSTSEATWLNKNRYFDLGQDFILFQKINKRKAINYQVGVRDTTEPRTHAKNYFFTARYREQVHQNWLFLEVNPGVNYSEDNSYKPIKYIIFKVEAVFGTP